MRQRNARRAHANASQSILSITINMTMQKKVIITLSRVFPKVHPRHNEPTLFKEHLGNTLRNSHDGEDKRKLHTIRTNFDRWKHNIDKINNGDFFLSVRQWSAAPYRSKQIEIYQLRKHIGYQRITLIYDNKHDSISAYIDGVSFSDIERLAANDGLSLEDFKSWFFPPATRQERNVIHGVIIHFTDYRY